jgi:hypothetical protein
MLNNVVGLLGDGVAAATNNFFSIATATGTGSSGVITFSSIPSTYKHLQLRYFARSTGATSSSELSITFNGDTTTGNYIYHRLGGNGSIAFSGASSAGQSVIGDMPGTSINSNMFSIGVVDILDYANTNKNKTVRSLIGDDYNGSGLIGLYSVLWAQTTAVNRIDITSSVGNYATNTQFALYGIS